MSGIRLTKNLSLHEYLPKELYLQYQGREHLLLNLLDPRLVKADPLLRERFGSLTINNWWWGGDRNWSGIRIPNSPYYSLTSQHSHGRASDKVFKLATIEEVIHDVKKNYKSYGITAIEEGVSWLHTDVRWSNNGLITFKA